MADLALALDQPAARLFVVSGGKGARLARMKSAGLPVPSGFIVTTDAFRSAGFALSDDLDRSLAAVDPADVGTLEVLCKSARQAIARSGVPDKVASAVRTAYDELGDTLPVSVRSSATSEDQHAASFAGQYDSFLNVIGLEAVLDRILKVWESLYSTRAVAYGLRLGIPHQSASMAVAVQKQLYPHAAGVLFTQDPVSGNEGRYSINVSLGLGEGVVAGDVPSDAFALDSNTLEIVEQKIARKVAKFAPSRVGGVERVEVPDEHQRVPALSEGQLSDLGKLSRRVVDLFYGHQDIEFAVDEDGVNLLQARPVTGDARVPPFEVDWEEPGDAHKTWIRGQGMLGQAPVYLLQEDAIRVYVKSSEMCFEETGAPQARNHIIRFFNGYPYVRSPDVGDKELSGRQERHLSRDEAYREKGTTLYEAEIRPQVERALADFATFRPKRASLEALLHHLERAIQAYGHVMGNLHWSMAGVTRFDWPTKYSEITGEAEVASGVLLQAIPNKTTRLVGRLRNLARLVQEDPELRVIFQENAYHRLREHELLERRAVQRFRVRFRSLLREYGLRTGAGYGSFMEFAAPTWNMDPRQPLQLVAAYAQHDLDALDRLEGAAKRGRKNVMRRIRRLLANDPDRLSELNSNLAMAVETVNRMENHNHLMEQGVTGALREAIFWIGTGLVRDGLLDHPDDVLHVSMDELRQITDGNRPHDLRTMVGERRDTFQSRARLRPPPTLGSGGPEPVSPMAAYQPPVESGLDGLSLRGVGASPGTAIGLANLAAPGSALPNVEAGDILVAQNVGPAWTPILPLLGGLVLDEGAVFQHAALVAREYGIPAVIMTRDATSVIVAGQRIRVDANRGIVELTPDRDDQRYE
ncbi:MAG: PEP-utilizing enzyme [Chloroflexi bacterium]|nr:PEP-utilizing enzyme [Chloroflexota bacterium]